MGKISSSVFGSLDRQAEVLQKLLVDIHPYILERGSKRKQPYREGIPRYHYTN